MLIGRVNESIWRLVCLESLRGRESVLSLEGLNKGLRKILLRRGFCYACIFHTRVGIFGH